MCACADVYLLSGSNKEGILSVGRRELYMSWPYTSPDVRVHLLSYYRAYVICLLIRDVTCALVIYVLLLEVLDLRKIVGSNVRFHVLG